MVFGVYGRDLKKVLAFKCQARREHDSRECITLKFFTFPPVTLYTR